MPYILSVWRSGIKVVSKVISTMHNEASGNILNNKPLIRLLVKEMGKEAAAETLVESAGLIAVRRRRHLLALLKNQ